MGSSRNRATASAFAQWRSMRTVKGLEPLDEEEGVEGAECRPEGAQESRSAHFIVNPKSPKVS